jgi:hypothetical protein
MGYTETPGTREAAWRRSMTPDQEQLAAELQARAERLRVGAADDGEGLSIREAVDLAAVQMGLAR